MIEDNKVTGNTNGIVLVAGMSGNIVQRNFVVGNPTVDTSTTNPAADGADIKNLAAPGTNTIDDNICLTAVNAPCPDVTPRRHDPRGERRRL